MDLVYSICESGSYSNSTFFSKSKPKDLIVSLILLLNKINTLIKIFIYPHLFFQFLSY